LLLIRRKGRRSDIENVLRGTEELLRGNFRWRVSTESRGALFKIASNINLLDSDFKARTSEIESVRDHYYHLVESLQDYAIVATNCELEIISFNRAAVSLFEWSAEEVKGKSSSILFSEAFWLALLPAIAREELKSTTHRYKSEFRKKSGEHFLGQATIDPLRSRSGDVIGFLIVIREASEDIHSEQELKESEERYRTLVESFGEGVGLLQDEKIIYANTLLCEMLGVSSEELIGQFFKDFIVAEDLLFALEELREIEKHEGSTRRIHLHIQDVKKLNIMEVLLTASSVSHRGQKAIICSVMDVTDSKRTEREIKHNESILDTTLDTVSEGLVMLHYSPRGPILVLANRSFENIFHMRSDDIIGKPFLVAQEKISKLIKDESAFLMRTEEWVNHKERKESVLFEMKGPENKILECFTAPVCTKGGDITGRLVAFQDVTGQKEFEKDLKGNVQELQESKITLERAYQELNTVNLELQMRTEQLDKLNQDLRTLDEMKTKLLANVSHELQTPLVSIKGYTEMILKGKLGAITEEQERGLQISLKNIERLIGMIENLLQFSRPEKEPEETDLRVFPIWELIDETIELVGENMEAKHISITTQYQTDELLVEADREKIAQVFINLLSNAIKFNRPSGKVSVNVRKGTEGYLFIDIADTGIGIAQEYLDKVFERFFRAEDPLRKIEGTGIGLSIVKDILEQHQCRIDVRSKIGEGTTFSFTLPMPKESKSQERSDYIAVEKKGTPEEKLTHFRQMKSKEPSSDRKDGMIKIKIIKKSPQNESL
jgi:PAS domain S-box-containing protein